MKRNSYKRIILLCMVCLVTMLCIPTKQVSAKSEVLLNTPEELIWGQSYSGEIVNSRYSVIETYKYTFTLSESGHVGMVFTAEKNPLIITIYDSAENIVYEVTATVGMTNLSSELLKGEYVMKITPNWYGSKFSFTPTFTASGETKSEAYDEKNNEIGLATSYKVGASYSGHFADNDTTDIYKMKVTGTGNLTVNVDSKLRDYDIKLVNDYGDISYQQTVTSGKHKYRFFVAKGTYYLQFLRGDQISTGIYSFNTSLSSIPKGKLSSVKNVKSCSLKVKWKKNSKITGYQLQIATNKKFTKNKKSFYITDNTTSSGKICNLKRRKTYYVRIRNYVTASNGKSYYSKWSGIKKAFVRR